MSDGIQDQIDELKRLWTEYRDYLVSKHQIVQKASTTITLDDEEFELCLKRVGGHWTICAGPPRETQPLEGLSIRILSALVPHRHALEQALDDRVGEIADLVQAGIDGFTKATGKE